MTAKKADYPCQQIGVIATLEEQAKQNQDMHEKLNGNLQRIWETLDTIKTDVNRRLPLWATWLFMVGSGVVTGLAVYLITRR